MKRILVFLSALCVCIFTIAFLRGEAFADGKLKKFKEAVKKEEPQPREKRRKRHKATDTDFDFDDEDEDEEENGFWNELMGEVFKDLFEAIGSLIYQEVFMNRGVRYRAYPYLKDNYVYHGPGKLLRAPGLLKMEYQRINSDLYGLTWRLTLRMGSGYDLSTTSTHYDEKLRSGEHDRMDFIKVRLNRLCSPLDSNLLVRVGFGGAGLDGYAGFDAGIELDWFPQKPLALHAGIGHTAVHYGNGITDIDVAVGIMTGPFEFALGYRGLITRGEQIDGSYIRFGFWF